MNILRSALIGYLIGGGFSTKLCLLICQRLSINSIDTLSMAMIIGGLIGATVAIAMTGKKGSEKVARQRSNSVYHPPA